MKNPDEKFMGEALLLAEKGRGKVSPNPLVGCVIAKDGKIVGKGWHERFGGAHAEINALKKAGKNARGATMYVGLEPCCHYGKTPPCTKAIIGAGIREVIIAAIDPNRKVGGRGLEELRKAGIKVKAGIHEKEAKKQNEIFFKYMETGRPFVIMKVGMSIDGKISYGDGRRKIITGKESWNEVHKLRSGVDAVLVGINTVMLDDPRLTARIRGGKNPVRIVADSSARIPLSARVLNDGGKTIIACTKKAKKVKIRKLVEKGAGIIAVKERRGKVDLKCLMRELGEAGISSVMIEGGAGIFSSAAKSGIVDKFLFFISPKIIGNGLSAFGGEKLVKDVKIASFKKLGRDLLLECSFGN